MNAAANVVAPERQVLARESDDPNLQSRISVVLNHHDLRLIDSSFGQ
jgi:hypothetical protein